jgi:hypothetical protein
MNKEQFEIRFFFDAGSGICLWAGNELTKNKFSDYPIEVESLPISENLIKNLIHLIAWWDTSYDWNYPQGPTLWDIEECNYFNKKTEKTYKTLVEELAGNYHIKNEFKPAKT